MKIKIFTLFFLSLFSYTSISQTAYSIFNNTKIATQINNGAVFFNNPALSDPAYEYPEGSGKHLIFASSFWFCAKDDNGNLHLSGQKYDLGEDLFPGPLVENYATITPSTVSQYDLIWNISKADIDNHIQNYNSSSYTMPASIADWPAHGDVAQGQDYYLAPFVDVDNNGIYTPSNGDYPSIRGDNAMYMILNDTYQQHAATGGDLIGIECHFMFYWYNDPGTLGHTTFLNLSVINRSTENYSDFKVGCFMDPDIGDATDDFMGCDSTANVMYAYNGSPTDAQYQSTPPAVGVVSLNRDLNAAINYSGSGSFSSIPNTPSGHSLNMDGYYNDASPFTYGGQGSGGTNTTKFLYSGNPNNNSEWSEYSEGNTPADRRMMASVKSEVLNAADQRCYDFAFVMGTGGNHIENVDSLLASVAEVQSYYDAQSYTACQVSGPAFITENEEIDVDVYPNPASDQFTVDLSGDYDLQITDMTGQIVFKANGLNGKEVLDLNLAPSNYILNVRQNDRHLSKKIVIL